MISIFETLGVSPNGWRLEHESKRIEHHEFAINRCRNIISAIENLSTQMGMDSASIEFARRLEIAKEVYQSEMKWHLSQIFTKED
jgi:hypothetical protein